MDPSTRSAPSEAVDKSSGRVRRMFGEIAGRYDLLNHVLSFGVDRSWRRKTVKRVPADGGRVLDVCTGTGDLALDYWRSDPKRVQVVGVDFCQPMLAVAGEKIRRTGAESAIQLVEADAMHLPFDDNTFDVVCVAFGLRNVADTDRGLSEMARVCRFGGRVAVLEFSLPRRKPFGPIYGWYFRHLLPRIGQAIARNRQSAYNYLPASVEQFPQDEAMVERFVSAGLSEVHFHPFTFGVATLYVGTKKQASPDCGLVS